MDIITKAALAYVTKDGIEKLLGPTFEYYGIGLKNTVESFNKKAKDNLNKIFQKSIIKKGERLKEKEIINPRILKEVVLDGSFCDTEIVQEYYSGILASSRTENGNDDGIYYINIIKGLSSRQLKFHYAIYSKFIIENKNTVCNLHQQSELSKMKVNFSLIELVEILGLKSTGEIDNFTSNDLPALYNAGLIMAYNFDTTRKETNKQFEFSIELLGISLFLQAVGYSEIFAPKCLTDPKIEQVINNIISLKDI